MQSQQVKLLESADQISMDGVKHLETTDLRCGAVDGDGDGDAVASVVASLPRQETDIPRSADITRGLVG